MSHDYYPLKQPLNLDRLRRDAKQLKREKNIPHTAALDQIAARFGYPNWPALVRKNTQS